MIDSNKPRQHEKFYGFRERPFLLQPDPAFLYMSGKHRAALDLLELAIFNQSGFCVISGDIGVGKTTLVRELLNRLDDNICVGMVTNTRPSFSELLQLIMASFGLKYDAADNSELQKRFIDFAIRQYADNRHMLLIIDEAQHLSVSALEELRMLSNINADKDLLLQVILVGQEKLHHKLIKPELAQFAQRIAIDYHLAGLDEQETREYIHYRVKHAGGSPDLFDDDACSTVYRSSEGVPRLINRICGLGLVYGYAEKSRVITPELVTAVVSDQHIGNLQKTSDSISKRGGDAFRKVAGLKAGDDTGPADDSNKTAPDMFPGPAATMQDEIEIPALEKVTVPKKKTIAGNTEASTGTVTGRKSPKPVAVTTTGNGNPDIAHDEISAEAIKPQRRAVSDIDTVELPGVEAPVADKVRDGGATGKRPGAAWMLTALVVVAGTAAVSGWLIRDYQDAIPAVDSVAVKPSIQPPPIPKRTSGLKRITGNKAAVIPAQREEEPVASPQRQAEQELAEQKEAEHLEQQRRQAGRELAEQKEAERLEQQRMKAERELAEQKEAERQAQQRRRAERKKAEQRKAQRLALQRREAERELQELGEIWERESLQLREESRLDEARRVAAEARLKEWSRESGWSDDAE